MHPESRPPSDAERNIFSKETKEKDKLSKHDILALFHLHSLGGVAIYSRLFAQ